ncbi:putative flap structure-specific endonuclease [Rosellinia necatrix]|uniref:Putative flap structure-specific endonuclease n=1 Tax=Rosellinia necatrix TaxID=77044 RepID=A0A1S8A551_ROSNE|nr:putative flap structure-specific endonuclease [Rosellinia necatrix]
MAKRLIRLFGFVIHDAPGEAEAECALLQQHNIVDAVLSEDVDTIMFGCTRTLRNWSSEGTRGSKAPTHVSMYDTQELSQGASGLDREGMVLVALMSGGDYLPEGIPGAGVKLACEAARAGFGKSLCQLKISETSELASWKERLAYELRHNESGFFRTRHKALTIPDDFPNMEILRYYTHPVVSPVETLDRLRQQVWDRQINIQELREFARETFDWSYRIGAIKFIKVLAPCLLVRKLMQRSAEQDNASTDNNMPETEESELVGSITSRRAHFSTDATPELRVSFIPTNIVGYDFQEEPDEVIEYGRDGLALNSDDEMEDPAEEMGDADSSGKSSTRKPFSPTDADLAWIPEMIVRTGVPSIVETWEETQRAKAVARSKPKASKQGKQKAKPGGIVTGTLDSFAKVTKNIAPQTAEAEKPAHPPGRLGSARSRTPLDAFSGSSQMNPPSVPSCQDTPESRPAGPSKPPTPKPSRSRRKPPVAPKADASVNPWTIARLQNSPRVAKSTSSLTKGSEPISIPSSPASSPTKAASSSIRSTRGGYGRSEPDPSTVQPASAGECPFLTPARPAIDEVDRGTVRDQSPTEKRRRKLLGTEPLPVESSSRHRPRQTRGSARAQAATVEIVSLDSDSEDVNEDGDDDGSGDDAELPPLSSLIRGSHKRKDVLAATLPTLANTPGSEPGVTDESKPLAAAAAVKGEKKKKQATLEQSLGAAPPRMTKLYMPRKSQPGFFREVDVSVDEADALKEEYAAAAAAGNGGRRAGVWRRSDISCVDLTGED